MTTLGDHTDARISLLKKKDRDVKRQRLIDIRSCQDSRIDEHLECTVFGPRCHSLCHLIYPKLPLELRDAIYECLFAESRVQVIMLDRQVHIGGNSKLQYRFDFFDMYDAVPYAHIFKDAYTPIAVRTEMLRIWSRNTKFTFDDSRALGRPDASTTSLALISFFDTDRCAIYELGDIIRYIELTLLLPRYHSKYWLLSSCRSISSADDWNRLWATDKLAILCTRYLLFLTKLKPGACITLSFMMEINDKRCEAREMLHRLFDILQHLLEHGHKVWVSVEPWLKFQVKKEDLTPECWMAKAHAHKSA